jgi:protein-disulfide isomerase
MRCRKHTWLIGTLGIELLASLGLWSAATLAFADSDPTAKSEVETLKHDLGRLKVELEGIKLELERMGQRLLRRPAPSTRPPDRMAQVRMAGNPILGRPDAPLTLIEFSDYQCPYCRRFFETTLPALKTEYIETGKVRYIFRDYPLDRLHPQARKAAEAARCAGDQGHYWAMHDVLFRHQQALQVEWLQAYAQSLRLDPVAFDACVAQGTYAAAVQQDVDDGTAAGVKGTPAFFLGKTRPEDTMHGTFISGAQPLTAFREAVERLLDAPQ